MSTEPGGIEMQINVSCYLSFLSLFFCELPEPDCSEETANPPMIAITVPPWATTLSRMANCDLAMFPLLNCTRPNVSAATVAAQPG